LEDGPLDTVHVTNVPYTTTETELSKAMEIFGTVKEVRIITDGQARSKGSVILLAEVANTPLQT
jgi:RNA recognition motif-containing protein